MALKCCDGHTQTETKILIKIKKLLISVIVRTIFIKCFLTYVSDTWLCLAENQVFKKAISFFQNWIFNTATNICDRCTVSSSQSKEIDRRKY